MSRSVWLVAGLLPGIERRPLKKMTPDQNELALLLERWRGEVAATGRCVRRVVVAYEAGRDGFWLARWLQAQEVECEVIHASSIVVSWDLVRWFRQRTADGRVRTKMAMVVALARKLLVALWRMARTGEVPEGVRLRPMAPVIA